MTAVPPHHPDSDSPHGGEAPLDSGWEPEGARRKRWVVLFLAGALLVTVALLLWSDRSAVRSVNAVRATQGLNVLLITIDTTRADALGCYGHPTIRTPHIDALARRGVRFMQCMSAAPITLPSHTSIMTSTYPFVHQARVNGSFVADEGNETLAEVLAARGYHTGAEVGAFVLDAAWGLDQGFMSYRSDDRQDSNRDRLELLSGEQSVPAENVCNRAIDWLRDRANQDPFFLWVHFFDPHQPWSPPARCAAPYADDRFGKYLGEIAYVDEQIGRLMEECERLGIGGRTLTIVTADHGESLLQHEELTHTYFVYDATMHVPLIWSCPGVIPEGVSVSGQVGTVDIAPTILSILGLEAADTFGGTSLVPLINQPDRDPGLVAYGESINAHVSFGYARLRTVRGGGWKYIHASEPELYNVLQDPGETTNLALAEPERLESMRAALEELVAESAAAGTRDPARTGSLHAEAAERLAALGYVGGYVPTDGDVSESELLERFEGADPKSHIKSYNAFLKATGWIDSNEPANAEPILRELIAAEPQNPGYRESYGDLLRKLGRPEDAIEQYQALLAMRPDHAIVQYRLGLLYGQLGRTRESVMFLTRAAEAMPDYANAHAYLALALMRQGQVRTAEQEFRTALRLDPAASEARLGFSDLLWADGRHADAIESLREGLRLRPDTAQLANNLAWYLAVAPSADLRRPDEAIAVAQSLVDRLGDDDPSLLDTLAAAHASAGHFVEAARIARKAVELSTVLGAEDLAGAIRERLRLYDAGEAYAEGVPPVPHP